MVNRSRISRFLLRPSHRQSISHVKVFGERNTGTNFLSQLVKKNAIDAEILEHGDNSKANSEITRFPPEYRTMVDERMRDYLRNHEFPENFGFKHAFVDKKRLEKSKKFSSTLFFFIVRNPYYFLTSLFCRPYSIVPAPSTSTTFDEFLRQPILLHEREYYDFPVVNSPVHLWSRKASNALSAHREISNSIFLRYEDLVADPRHFLALAQDMGLSVRDDVLIPNHSTKGDPLSFEDYQKRTLQYDPLDHYSRENLQHIRDTIDLDVCNKLQYEIKCAAKID